MGNNIEIMLSLVEVESAMQEYLDKRYRADYVPCVQYVELSNCMTPSVTIHASAPCRDDEEDT